MTKTKAAKTKSAKPKRNIKMPPVLEPTEAELTEVKTGLTQYYSNNPNFLKNGETIDSKIDEVIEKCKVGWVCASKTSFIKRVQWYTKWNSTSIRNRFDYQPNYAAIEQIKTQEAIKKKSQLSSDVCSTILRGMLTSSEKKFWLEKEEQYRSEFEFNTSSDSALLMQLLLEELTLFRYASRRIQNPDDNSIEDLITESNKRLINAQKALGVTREQRENATNEADGNIAQLSLIVDEKLSRIEKIKEKDRLEEEAMMQKHINKEALSLVRPDMAEVLRRIDEDSDVAAELLLDGSENEEEKEDNTH